MMDSMNAEMKTIQITKDVLVLGGGLVGLQTAKAIADQGYPVLLAAAGETTGLAAEATPLAGNDLKQLEALTAQAEASDRIQILHRTQLAGAAGMPGDFTVWLAAREEVTEKQVGAIVVAGDVAVRPLNEAYGLKLADNVLSQSLLETRLAADPGQMAGKTVAFLVGLAQPGNPLNMERVFHSVLALTEVKDCTVYIYVGDLKVASDQLERLYLQTRDKGALYFKLKQAPALSQAEGRLSVTYNDPVILKEVQVQPDLIVVEEAIEPGAVNPELAEMLRIDLSPSGFLQTDNVHRYPVATNREGIYVVNGCREVKNIKSAWMDSQNAALQISALLGDGTRQVSTVTKLDAGKCTFCLTCYRCCPHGAIYWESESNTIISPTACQACGICASECPMDAIQIGGFSDAEMKTRIKTSTSQEAQTPKIVAFCCQNSALEAGRMAADFKMPLPEGLQMVQVPCAGKVDLDYILTAFVEGADGVLVMTCHPGNCKSERGNTYAGWRVKEARRMLTEIGMGADKLRFVTLAANMGSDFARIVNEMAADLKVKA
jgi:coenzyme F420-reducing hydrogenase delta subunit/Pyruvate/2-oxoacid:ferredoxin oxidoreductase delta subunit